MASEAIATLRQQDAFPGAGGIPAANVATNLGQGLGFPAGMPAPFTAQVCAAYFQFYVPAAIGLATGMTVNLVLVDDLANPGAGLKATFDVQYAFVGATTTELDTAFSGTNDSVQVTMPATSGQLKTQAIAAINAHMAGSVAASSWVLLRVRRNAAASDTHTGRIILRSVYIMNT